MKTAIISDIHSNPTALNICIADAEKKGCERIVCLGDIVGYGYDPVECIRICKDKNIRCILGNHDAGLVGRLSLDWFNGFAKAAIERQIPLVGEEDKKWIDHLPYKELEWSEVGVPIAFAHGTFEFPGKFDYIQGPSDVALEFPYLKRQRIRALFVGHTHFANAYFIQEDYSIDELYIDYEDATEINLDNGVATIVNVGSCGYPRNQPFSIYCIYDDEKHTATHQILPFDFDDYIAKMQAVGATVPLWVEAQKEDVEKRGGARWK